jgi:hypothetical protein
VAITVYGVASPEEGRRLEQAGADVIGVLLGDRLDGRVLDEPSVLSISRTVSMAGVCVEPCAGSMTDPELLRRVGARWVQVPWNAPAPRAWREQLAASGIGWVLGRVPADEDDDPEWVVNRWTGYGDPAPNWVHVEIFPDLLDGWSLLQEPSPDEIDTSDLDSMAAERPMVFSLPLTVGRAAKLRAVLPHAHGFALTLAGHHGEVPAATVTSMEEALRLVGALRHILAIGR